MHNLELWCEQQWIHKRASGPWSPQQTKMPKLEWMTSVGGASGYGVCIEWKKFGMWPLAHHTIDKKNKITGKNPNTSRSLIYKSQFRYEAAMNLIMNTEDSRRGIRSSRFFIRKCSKKCALARHWSENKMNSDLRKSL